METFSSTQCLTKSVLMGNLFKHYRTEDTASVGGTIPSKSIWSFSLHKYFGHWGNKFCVAGLQNSASNHCNDKRHCAFKKRHVFALPSR